MTETKVLSYYSSKGGVGKSTLTEITAVNMAQMFEYSCLIIDTDSPQYTIYNDRADDLKYIQNKAENSPEVKAYNTLLEKDVFVKVEKAEDADKVEQLIGKYRGVVDFIFIDLKGEISENTLFMMAHVDFIFIPITTSKKDYAASLKLYSSLIDVMRKYREFKITDIVFIFNLLKHYPTDFETFTDMKKQMKAQGVNVFGNPIYNYKIYENVSTIFPFKPSEENHRKGYKNHIVELVSTMFNYDEDQQQEFITEEIF